MKDSPADAGEDIFGESSGESSGEGEKVAVEAEAASSDDEPLF